MFKLAKVPRLYSAISPRWTLPGACIRLTSTVSKVPSETSPTDLATMKEELQAQLAKELPKPYDGPERDHVNFPRPKRPEYPGVLRYGFLPQEWFDFFYKKTGTTGPYVFGVGLVTFLLSKEWYVIEEQTSTLVTQVILAYIAFKKLGPTLAKYRDRRLQEEIQKKENMRSINIASLKEIYENDQKTKWYGGNLPALMQAKRENVHIQLETEFRRRQMMVYEQVKRRLDYFLDMETTRKKLEQKHMVDWIVQNVIKSITSQQEKEVMAKCIIDLKALSARA